MCQYSRIYQQKRKQNDEVTKESNTDGHISFTQYKELVKTKRVCINLQQYAEHVKSINPYKNGAKCAVCGIKAFNRCDICKVPLHDND